MAELERKLIDQNMGSLKIADEKEQLVLALKDSGKTCMMCGDGANDVGALKQAQVPLPHVED